MINQELLHFFLFWQLYIVYLGEHSGNRNFKEIEDHHHSYLFSVKDSSNEEEAKGSLVHSYKNVINGFSALLTPEEANKLSEAPGVISVFESQPQNLRVQTTRSWDFINLLEADGDPIQSAQGEALKLRANFGKDVIVGVFDSGMEPIPASWKGICQVSDAFKSSNCNKKIIGARYYSKQYVESYGPINSTIEYASPRDKDGHGTHTASTIGGRRVANVSALGGFANGNVSGGAPLVRLAIYKACWKLPNDDPSSEPTCFDADILNAFDDAINDGVHIISISVGGNTSKLYTQDGIAIGALHAAKRNVIVVCSAGNSGPTPYSVTNVAPWILTVGASSMDRVFPASVILGNGVVVQGQTVTPYIQDKSYPLVYADDVEIPGTTTNLTTGLCSPGTLSPALVRGKIVFCWVGDISEAAEVERAGGVAAILGYPSSWGEGIIESPFVLPGLTVFSDDRYTIVYYILNHTNPTATLVPGKTTLGAKPAPFMAPFTSVGPNLVEPNILKPDVTAPGLNILAAWSGASPVTSAPGDNRFVKYNIESGTSMSCPHVSAVAALLKALHPDWSTAAIRSAIMTSARVTNNMGKPITNAIGNISTPFEYGSGHIQPSKAVDPGLIYDTNYTDYLLYLCSRGYTNIDPDFQCPLRVPTPSNLNYPSISISSVTKAVTVTRSVTNVGTYNSTYSVKIQNPPGFSVQIVPTTLQFSQIGEIQSFSVTVRPDSSTLASTGFSFGWYVWSDGVHIVRSPIALSPV
ncbi:hypothetical protein M9H77_11089 [Catharanthus roseus]|uniref:Uncharacterized protein n=1 Tax=Catharanthus roseus TaxID=4058 RepID=A0ACC0BDL4_CATRO|nr:hypothetical protein M9H77_11089 [Catharanthus roseus]